MARNYTPGPWRWEVNQSSKDVNLCGGKNPYDLTVIDFVRWGMAGAAPRFNVDYGHDLQLMERCDKLTVPVKGRKHHASWFQDINHPDARLIAAAPDLLEALELAVWIAKSYDMGRHKEQLEKCDIAIAKALGKEVSHANS